MANPAVRRNAPTISGSISHARLIEQFHIQASDPEQLHTFRRPV